MIDSEKINLPNKPDQKINVQKTFGIETKLNVLGFKEKTQWVPTIDSNYVFDKNTTLAILAGFEHDRRVMIQGYHGTGKSTHIEQVAARLNWPCIRVNLDSHISRIDLIGKDAIVIEDGKQITKFKEGILPWSIQNPVALVFDEYDAGRPDVMFVIQRVLEKGGNFTLLDQNKVLKQHPFFRLFATTNTIGLGDTTGLYQGTQQINQGQLDRWNIITTLNYLKFDKELEIILEKIFITKSSKEWIDCLLTNSIPSGPILNMKEAWNDPHLKSRNMDVKLDHPAQKSIQNIGVAVKLHSTPGKIKTPAPLYGEHTKDILLELNFSKSEIEDLIQNNIAGMS